MNFVFFRTSWPALLYPYAPNVAGGFGVSFGAFSKGIWSTCVLFFVNLSLVTVSFWDGILLKYYCP